MKRNKNRIFEGWYLKHQVDDKVYSFIVSFHLDGKGEGYGCVQFISNEGSYYKKYALEECVSKLECFQVGMGDANFSLAGVKASIDFADIKVTCDVKYDGITSPKTPIMGPLQFIKCMECSHEVLSLTHKLCGYIELNGQRIDLSQGVGYIEKDSGTSFPKWYMWTQCNFFYKGNHSIMAALADVPFGRKSFAGMICEVFYDGRHYRMATYLGGRAKIRSQNEIILKQGRRRLYIRYLENQNFDEMSHELLAPNNGTMGRKIMESAACKVRYTFYEKGKMKFDFVANQASYEWVMKS